MRFLSRSPLLLRTVEQRLLGMSPPRALLASYVGLSLIGALLLKLPQATTHPISWMQALFTAVSAATITGLTAIDVGTQLTPFGQWVVLLLVQAGGLGLMTFGVFVILLTRGQLTLSHQAAMREVISNAGHGDMRRLLRWMVGFTLGVELLGTLLLACSWVPELGWQQGLFASVFHAVMAFNNAGLSLFPDSLSRYVGHPWVNGVVSALLITGGIGFVVVLDIVHKRQHHRSYSLHTRLMLGGTLVLSLLAMLLILLLEHSNPATLGGLPSWGEQLWAAWFQAVTPRSAGFNTVNIGAMLPATGLLLMVLMFIGGGSGSTAGGIKLTTFVVLLLATRTFLSGRERPTILGRSIDPQVVYKSLSITVISLFTVVGGMLVLSITEAADFLDLAFETVSAFSTAGLSRGLTSRLSDPGLATVMLLMLIGRVGPLTLVFTLTNRQRSRIQYPVGQVNVG